MGREEVAEEVGEIVSAGVDDVGIDVDVVDGSEVAVEDKSQVGVTGVKLTGPYGSSSSSA